MRQISDALKAKLLLSQQTLYNGANLYMDVKVLRPTTPLTSKDYMLETIVDTASCTASSVAIRRMRCTRSADYAYVAYVSSGTLYVRRALIKYPITSMSWELIETIAEVTNCALCFDGSFVEYKRKVEFITEETPWLFYTTANGQLMSGILGGEYNSLVGANVTSLDVIRGVASALEDIDQGVMVFYILDGVVYYNTLLGGVWQGQETDSTYFPANAASLKVGRTFDWRVVLHVTDTAGALYEIFSKMYASGWNGKEYLQVGVTGATVNVIDINYADYFNQDEYLVAALNTAVVVPYGDVLPVMRDAWNYDDGNGDYGFYVCLRWTDSVDQALPETVDFTMMDSLGVTWYPQEITRSDYPNRLLLKFMNFNNASNPLVVHYTLGSLTWLGSQIATDSVSFNATNLVPYYVDPPVIVSVANIDNQTIHATFSKKLVQLLSQNGWAVSGFEPFCSPEGQLVSTNYVNSAVTLYDDYTVQIALTYDGRMRYPQGNVTLLFTGQLIGEDVAVVPAFSYSFVPTISPIWFKPNDPEYVTAGIYNATLTVFDVNYMSAQNGDEFLKAGAYSATIVITNVGGLPL